MSVEVARTAVGRTMIECCVRERIEMCWLRYCGDDVCWVLNVSMANLYLMRCSTGSQYSLWSSESELDMDWIHPWIGLNWVGWLWPCF